MICQLGTFDVENYGDLLYPLVFQHLLTNRYPKLPLQHYSLLAGAGPQGAGFETRAIKTLFEDASPRTLVIGGGDILRTDWDLMARHYGRNSRVSLKGLRLSLGTSGLAGYTIYKNLPRLEPGGYYAKRFRQRWMNYPAAGPFLINPQTLGKESAVAYLSCGVPHDFTAAEADHVKQTLEQARFIALRDEQSAEKLRRVGVQRQLHVAPDLTVLLSDQIDHDALVRRGRTAMKKFGVKDSSPVLCFQSQPYPTFSEAEILSELSRYREKTGSEIVALPLAYCHGDHEFLQSLAKQSGGTVKYADVYSVFDMLAIIAASDVFVGTSLHGNITAFSFGIPHVLGPLPVDKAEGFLNIAGLPADLKMGSWGEINKSVDRAVSLGGEFRLERAREAKAKVYRVVEQLFQSLQLKTDD